MSFVLIIAYLGKKNAIKQFQLSQINKVSKQNYKLDKDMDNLLNIFLFYLQVFMIGFAVIPELQEKLNTFYLYLFKSINFSKNIMCILPLIGSLSNQVSEILYQIFFKVAYVLILFIIQYVFKLKLKLITLYIAML